VTIRVVLADAHRVFLTGLKHLLTADGGFEVTATCTTGAETLAAVRDFRPDVLVTDLQLKGTDGLRVLMQLQEQGLAVRTVVLSNSLSTEEAIAVMRVGVSGVILKDMADEQLKRCIRKVHDGGRWMETQSLSRAIETVLEREAGAQEAAKRVSRRELGVIRLTAKGLRNKEIATQLGITEGTVKAHLHSIYEKLRVRGRTALIAYAQRKGLA
jgi:two-component system, NarL family, nitrate/nitrite response regulator NarL